MSDNTSVGSMPDEAVETVPADIQPVHATAQIAAVIERAATNPEVDIDKMERLLAMQERLLARDAEQQFTQAFTKAKQKMGPILKNRRNDTTRSTFADLETISLAIDPAILEHGFILSFGTADCPLENHYRVTAELSHEAGHSRAYQVDIPIDNVGMKGQKNKTDTHGFGSSMTYGRRYLKCLIWDVALTDDDGNAAGAQEHITELQMETLADLIDETQTDVAAFCGYIGIPCLAQMPMWKYATAEKKLLLKKQKMEAANA